MEAHIEKSDPEVNKEGWLFTHANGKRRKGMISAFQGACRRVQTKYGDHLLQDFHIHDLRHTFATWSHAHGADALTLKGMGGWQSLAMVDRYVNPGQEKARMITNSLPAPISTKEEKEERLERLRRDLETGEIISREKLSDYQKRMKREKALLEEKTDHQTRTDQITSANLEKVELAQVV